jgi:hypothetical protein
MPIGKFRPSPALILAALALFVALGGTAYAVTAINGRLLVNRSVPGAKLKLHTLTTNEIGKLPAVRTTNATAESIAGARQSLTFDTDVYDSGGLHNVKVNSSRLTALVAGVYDITGGVQWAANATGIRDLFIVKNGATVIAASEVPGTSPVQEVSTQVRLNTREFVQLQVAQDSGAALDVEALDAWSPVFAMHWVGR